MLNESQVAELSRLLKEKNQQLYIIQEESLAQQSTITCLSEKISSLEKQKQAVDEQLLAYEEMVANLEEEMLKSQKCEEELQKSKVRLESEVKAGQLREEDLKESYATVSQKFLILEENFRKSRDRHRSNIRILQSDMDSLRRELNSARKELESSKEQFEKYKVRAHSVLKQQKQNAAGANTSETSDVESESVIENMKRQIDYLEKQLQMERDATKTARDDCEVMAQKHQHVLLEQKKEWRNRLDEVKQNAKDMAKELRKQLDLQHEKLSAEYQKKLEEKDAEYGQTIEKLKNELGEVHKMSAQAPTAPLQEMAAAGGDFSTLERQAGEGSESVTPPQQPLQPALDGLLRSLLGRIVLKEKLDAAGTFSKLIKIDLENPNNIIGIAAFDIGLAAKMNKECLVENMKEESLVAQRLVYDEVSAAGGVAEVDVTDKMIDMVRSSNIKWKEDLERKKKERLDVLDAERKKKRTAALVKELESKKQKLMEDAQLQVSMLQQEIESLKQ
nr:GRIP and coiled-coil domain-containing protein 2-like [Rhipicephalus microplus]